MKIYEAWDALKLWLERFDREEMLSVGMLEDKIEQLEYEYE